ncbi:MAG: DUF2971 domain-containing protein [Limisphaerales bacterium]
MTIFRYFHPDRVDTLEGETVTFTPPNKFNDPFEMRPVIAPVRSKSHLMQGLRQAEAQEGLPDELAALPRKERRAQERQIRKATIAHLLKNASTYASQMQQVLPDEFSAATGVLCFSSVKDSLLMWAHYADSHRGFVVEYDAEHPEFQKLGKPQAVTYTSGRPVYDVSKGITTRVYLVKSPEWAYEREFRIFRRLRECEKRIINGIDLYFVRLPRCCVKAVYLGSRIASTIFGRISDLSSSSTPFRLYQAKLHQKEFSLVFDEVT